MGESSVASERDPAIEKRGSVLPIIKTCNYSWKSCLLMKNFLHLPPLPPTLHTGWIPFAGEGRWQAILAPNGLKEFKWPLKSY